MRKFRGRGGFRPKGETIWVPGAMGDIVANPLGGQIADNAYFPEYAGYGDSSYPSNVYRVIRFNPWLSIQAANFQDGGDVVVNEDYWENGKSMYLRRFQGSCWVLKEFDTRITAPTNNFSTLAWVRYIWIRNDVGSAVNTPSFDARQMMPDWTAFQSPLDSDARAARRALQRRDVIGMGDMMLQSHGMQAAYQAPDWNDAFLQGNIGVKWGVRRVPWPRLPKSGLRLEQGQELQLLIGHTLWNGSHAPGAADYVGSWQPNAAEDQATVGNNVRIFGHFRYLLQRRR